MCLASVTETYEKPTAAVVSASKVFSPSGYGKISFQNMPLRGVREVPLDRWITAEAAVEEIAASDWKKYRPGFHVYEADQKVAGERRVYVRMVRVRGRQDGKIVLIADEMFVPTDPSSWPPLEGKSKKRSGLDRLKGKILGRGGHA